MRIPPATRRSIPPCGYAHRHPRPPRCVRCSGRIVFRGVAHQSYRRRWAVPHERPRVGTGHHLSVRAGPHAADAQPGCLEAAGTRFPTGPSADGTPPHGARARGWRSGPLLVTATNAQRSRRRRLLPSLTENPGNEEPCRRARLLSAPLESHLCSTGPGLPEAGRAPRSLRCAAPGRITAEWPPRPPATTTSMSLGARVFCVDDHQEPRQSEPAERK